MENILAIAEGSITSEITTFDLIDHNVFQEFALGLLWNIKGGIYEQGWKWEKIFNFKILQSYG